MNPPQEMSPRQAQGMEARRDRPANGAASNLLGSEERRRVGLGAGSGWAPAGCAPDPGHSGVVTHLEGAQALWRSRDVRIWPDRRRSRSVRLGAAGGADVRIWPDRWVCDIFAVTVATNSDSAGEGDLGGIDLYAILCLPGLGWPADRSGPVTLGGHVSRGQSRYPVTFAGIARAGLRECPWGSVGSGFVTDPVTLATNADSERFASSVGGLGPGTADG
jgi:hypothetical protein